MPDTPSRRRPSGQTVLSVVGALVGLAFAIGLYRNLGPDTGAATQERGYVVDSAEQVTVEFELARSPGRAATCVVRARGENGGEVGRRQFDVAASSRRSVVVREPLATTSRANTGEVVGCRLVPEGGGGATPSP